MTYSILIVDDDSAIKESVEEYLNILNYNVKSALNADEALAILKSFEADVVLTDIMMQGMDGLELTRKIKEINSEQIVIILSAHDEPQYVQDLRDAGINDFIFKPLNIQQFIDTMYANCKTIHDKKNSL